MKKNLLLIAAVLIPCISFAAKTLYTYKLEKFSAAPVENFVYPNANNLYSFVIKLDPSQNGFARVNFKVELENCKFTDGSTVNSTINENQNFNVIFDDVSYQNGIIKIASATATNTSTDSLKAGTPVQLSYKIATLKGQVPDMSVSTNPLIGSKQQITAQVNADVIYPDIFVSNGLGGYTNLTAEYYEWTLPPNWTAAGQTGSTFILGANQKSITITPDYVTAGEIKVRALNWTKTAGSETKSVALNRGFSYTAFPTSITFGDISPKTFSATLFNGITYEWSVPAGWQING